MKRLQMALALALGLSPVAAAAESLLLSYYTTLSPRDTYNSKGVPLNDFCAVVQQDRANVYRFGNPDGDAPDGFFTTPERRAMITGRCDYARGYHSVDRIRSRFNGFVYVSVFGVGGTVTRVQIVEGAG